MGSIPKPVAPLPYHDGRSRSRTVTTASSETTLSSLPTSTVPELARRLATHLGSLTGSGQSVVVLVDPRSGRVQGHVVRFVPRRAPLVPSPAMQLCVGEVHEAIAAAMPDHEALVFRDRRFTWSQLTERTRRLANLLVGEGLGCRVERSRLAGWQSGQDHLASTSTTATSTSSACSAPTRPGWRRSTSTTATSPRSCATCSPTPGAGHRRPLDVRPTLAEVLPDVPS
jgi:hypothetical protein